MPVVLCFLKVETLQIHSLYCRTNVRKGGKEGGRERERGLGGRKGEREGGREREGWVGGWGGEESETMF